MGLSGTAAGGQQQEGSRRVAAGQQQEGSRAAPAVHHLSTICVHTIPLSSIDGLLDIDAMSALRKEQSCTLVI